MAFDINNFVIDRVLRGVMTSTATGEVMWSVNQIRDPSLSITADSVEVTDAIGSRIAQFDRAKQATLSATNGLFDLGLFAAQSGTNKNIASSTNIIKTPIFEDIEVTSGQTTVTLQKIPSGEVSFLYILRGDSTLGEKFPLSATDLNPLTGVITLPAGVVAPTRIFVMYEYDATSAVEVVNTATEFPYAGKFVMEVLGQDVCNATIKYRAYIIFGNAKLSASFDLGLAPDSGHPFEIAANSLRGSFIQKCISNNSENCWNTLRVA